ncbi:MAG: methylmalonyl Co-A mutase-associated GTPase MeaB [Pseudobdellovibrionaceae bacterium]
MNKAKAGDRQAFAKLLTWLENAPASWSLSLTELFQSTKPSFRVGITGPPGAGKSTLVGGLIKRLRQKGLRLGIMAVDPSSPFTHGAILGDRIRYAEYATDPDVFIRSLGTRGSLGGLSSSAFLMARAFDVCDFDLVLIETVGVGQTELDILHVADKVCVVLVPESGDSIQAMKAGLMEIADLFVVNKGDRPGADGLVREIQISLTESEGAETPSAEVIKCTATAGEGLNELSDWILRERDKGHVDRNSSKRLQEEAKALLRADFERSLKDKLVGIQSLTEVRALFPDVSK